MDKNGPLKVLKSAMKIDTKGYQGTLHNMKLHPSALKTDADLEKLITLIKTYLRNGGKHIQFNVVDNKTLIAAQETQSFTEETAILNRSKRIKRGVCKNGKSYKKTEANGRKPAAPVFFA